MITYRVAIILLILFFLFCAWVFFQLRRKRGLRVTTVDLVEPPSIYVEPAQVDQAERRLALIAPVQERIETEAGSMIDRAFDNRQGERIEKGDWYSVYRGFMSHDEIVREFPHAKNLDEKRAQYEKGV